MSTCYLDDHNRFVIEDYNAFPPFASFLPGIAGPLGVPLWAFYVNRGQAVTSFGVESKNSPVVEFEPANKAYQATPFTGFRTFVKVVGENGATLYEPFAPWSSDDRTRLIVSMNELELQARSAQHGLQTEVVYFTLTGEPFAGLARTVKVTNTGQAPVTLEVLDGLPRIIPFGADNRGLKEVGRTLEAWMDVLNLERRLPFYRMRASTGDEAEVTAVTRGHFALAFTPQPDSTADLLPVLVDPALVFGQNTSLATPDHLRSNGLDALVGARQFTSGKTPCAFFAAQAELAPGQSLTLCEVFGHASSVDRLTGAGARLLAPGYFQRQRQAAAALAQELTDPIATQTSHPVFDAYCRQTFLDNVLRGGWPVILPRAGQDAQAAGLQRRHVYYVYARKHGDLERDYNDFFLAAEPFSQGNGNYRDVNQNRRSDVLFEPAVGDFNIRLFMSLIQADGYNPLVVQGTNFTLPEEARAELLSLAGQPESLAALLNTAFTPGSLLQAIEDQGIELRVPAQAFLDLAMARATQEIRASHGEGFWVDHWTYNLDLIDSYLVLYPERKHDLLFGTLLPFFDNAATVQPRSETYVLAGGHPHQFHAVAVDEEKAALIASRAERPHWARADGGRGAIFTVTLFEKLAILALLKVAALDPSGMGVEMEAGKPGWYDALNGLPGIFGSSLAESFALQRLLAFLLAVPDAQAPGHVELPVEAHRLLQAVADRLDRLNLASGSGDQFACWDDVATAREAYRRSVRLGFDGAKVPVATADLMQTLRVFLDRVDDGIRRAVALGGGLPPTYLVHEADDYEVVVRGSPDSTPGDGRPQVRVKGFRPKPMPAFLEGAVRAMSVAPDRAAARALHGLVRDSELLDRKLGMYKVNAPLRGQPHSIGRARAFTPGWLENESIWLHMAYKYLLALLRAGLYDEFWADARAGLVPFMDPEVLGRSPLENSSFLVSSAHPDPSLHGQGFVARLSGATAEFLEMWQLFMAGPAPFFLREGQVCLALRPALPGWLFDDQDRVRFRFLGRTEVTYHNPSRGDTWRGEVLRFVLTLDGGESVPLAGPVIDAPYAELVRAGKVQRIDAFFLHDFTTAPP